MRRAWVHTFRCVLSLAVFGLVTPLLLGCHSPLSDTRGEARLVESGEFRVVEGLDVPEVSGPSGCGAQGLAAVLAFDDPSLDAGRLAADLPWHDLGATPVDLLLEARSRGLTARIERGEWAAVRDAIERDRPVLVMLDVGYEVRTLVSRLPTGKIMHWAVASGVSEDDSRILLATTGARHHVVPRDEFLNRWDASDHCMIVVSPPE